MKTDICVSRDSPQPDLITESLQSGVTQDEQNSKRIADYFIDKIVSPAEKSAGDQAKKAVVDQTKKAAVDQAFRDVLKDVIVKQGSSDEFYTVINMAASAVPMELTNPSILFILMQDMFDCITLDKCEEMFSYLEDRVALWKSETYYNAGKNYLLRMCNDLLRRLSRSKNTVFCGRIQLFLAKLFPLSEKSGLNLMSQFNLDNITQYNTKAEDYEKLRKQSVDDRDDSMEVEEGETSDHPSNITIDYNLYRKIWSLQDYCRRPVQCYDKTAWKTFTAHSDDVLSCFESFKLDDMKSQKRRQRKKRKAGETQAGKSNPEPIPSKSKDEHVYFPKYLTSEKLLDLQLSDSNFRRDMLVQLLIVCQYLQAQVKFKGSTQVVTDEQTAWIKLASERALQVLRETPPDGEKFAETIQHVMSREDNWNNWKNDGCPSFVRDSEISKVQAPASSKKRSVGDDLKSSGGKLIKMGNSELTRLWNICPNNMEACMNKQSKNLVPQLEDFFEDAIDQMDPEAMVEDQYKLIKNPTFAWKSLRLLSRKSPHFFANTPNQQKKKVISEYLEGMLDKLAKEMPSSQSGEVKSEDVDDSVDHDSGDAGIQEDQLGDNKPDDDGDSQNRDESIQAVSKDLLQDLAARLTEEWKKLGSELNFPEDDLAYIESESEEAVDQALKMLTIWQENELEKATIGVLRSALKEIGQESVATEVFGESDDS